MGVGPSIHVPFLLEHSFSECGFRPGGDGPSPPPGLRVGVGYFLRLWVRVVRESAARLEIVLQDDSRTAPHANAMGAPLASPTQRSMLEFQHSLYTHSKCLRTL